MSLAESAAARTSLLFPIYVIFIQLCKITRLVYEYMRIRETMLINSLFAETDLQFYELLRRKLRGAIFMVLLIMDTCIVSQKICI